MKKTGLLFLGLLLYGVLTAQISIQQARSLAPGTSVTVSGIVTNGPELGTIRYMQDNTAGIAVYDNTLGSLNRGDSITVSGTLVDYNGLLEISNVTSHTVHATGLPVPAPKVITLASGFSNANEGQLLRVNGVHFSASGTFSTSSANYSITDGSQTREVRIWSYTNIGGTAIPSGNIDLVGLMGEYNGTYQLQPRDLGDFHMGGPKITSPLQQSNITTSGFTVTFTTQDPGNTIIRYGLTASLGSEVADPAMTTSHITTLTGLSPATIYFVQGASVDVNGDTSFSEVKRMATASLSSGDIRVYFNRSVDHSVSTGTPAKLLWHAFDDTLIAYISRAKHTIDLAIYNFDNLNFIVTALNDAYNRGVTVRVIANYGVNGSAYNMLNIGSGRKKKSPSGPAPSGGNYGEMHNKLMIIDANSADPDDPVVITGSTNFTNNQLMTDPNNLIIFRDQTLARACKLEFDEMWSGKFGPEKTDNTPHLFSIGGREVELYFAPSDAPEEHIKSTITTADHDLYFALFAWTRYNMAYDIRDKITQEGVFAAGIINDTSSGGAAPYNILYPYMTNTLFLYHQAGILHHKYLIVDAQDTSSDPLVLTGSYNWSSNARNRNDENYVIVHDADIANQYFQEWAQRYRDEGGTVFVGLPELTTVPGQFRVYPNPAATELAIDAGNEFGNGYVEVFDLSGKLCLRQTTGSEQLLRVNVSGLVPGMYLFRVYGKSGTASGRFLKQ